MSISFRLHRLKVFTSREAHSLLEDGSRARNHVVSDQSIEDQFNEWNEQMQVSILSVGPVSHTIVGKDAHGTLHSIVSLPVIYAAEEVFIDEEEETSEASQGPTISAQPRPQLPPPDIPGAIRG